MNAFAVQVDGAALGSVAAGTQPVTLIRYRGKSNTTFTVNDVVDAVGRPLTPLEEDWLDLLHAIHITDLVCRRGDNENYPRDIRIAVPLRSPRPFVPAVPLIQEMFGMMTHDTLRLELSQYATPPAQRFPRAPSRRPDAVVLLSGGLDSACAAASAAKTYKVPFWVSARSSSHVNGAQNEIVRALKKVNSNSEHIHFHSVPRHSHQTAPLPESDLSQRSRTLLYLGVAALIAAAHQISEAILGENGIMAINCPLTAGRSGGFSTKTAHPAVLKKFENIFAMTFRTSVRVNNPLLLQTKAEVVKHLAAQLGRPIIKKTHSCWIARQREHCGHCVPCLVRRFATEAAGVKDVAYKDDAFKNPLGLNEDGRGNVGDYLLFARMLGGQSDDDLMLDYPELLTTDDGVGTDALIRLHRRWAKQVSKVIKKHPALNALY